MVIPTLSVAAGLGGAETVAQEHGYALLVADSRFDLNIEARNIKTLLERRVDGLLCNPVESSRNIYDLVRESGVPTVIWAWVVQNRMLPTAVMRESDAIDAAVGHLIEEGHQDISIVSSGGPLGTGSTFRQRLIHEALASQGLNSDGSLDRVVPTVADCSKVIHELLSLPQRPTAFIINTRFAPAILQAMRDARVMVPRDVSVIWFGESQWAKLIDPPLNVIALDLPTHGAAAMRLLIGLVEGEKDLPQSIEHQSAYIRRASVGSAPSRRGQATHRSRNLVTKPLSSMSKPA
jgi:LacI family transcriptional regulator